MDVNESKLWTENGLVIFCFCPPIYSFKTTFKNDGNLSPLDISTGIKQSH